MPECWGPAPGCPEAWSGCLPSSAAPAPRAIELAVGRPLNRVLTDFDASYATRCRGGIFEFRTSALSPGLLRGLIWMPGC